MGMSSRDVVICRSVEDYNTATNCLALSAFSTNTSILADSVMSNHLHTDVETENLDKFALGFRLRYSKYFNRKYGVGAFPTLSCFSLELLGQNHIIVALDYVLRNGLHHGQCATAFGYPFSSVNSYFRDELGRSDLEYGGLVRDRTGISSFLPRHSEFPDSWVMNSSGLLLRSSFEDIKRVENIYVSPRSFLYNMNRITGSSLVAEQLKDDNDVAPITLDLIESCDGKSLTEMLNNEYGKVCDYRKTDLQVCGLIDGELIGRYGKSSVFLLSPDEKNEIARVLMNEFHIYNRRQLRRCLAIGS